MRPTRHRASALLLGASVGLALPLAAQLTTLGAVSLHACAAPANCLEGERWSRALAVGDFDDDGYEDLAVFSHETVGGDAFAGGVHVLYGSPGGLTHEGEQLFNGDSPGIGGAAEASDLFGSALAAADFDFDGYDDLAIGIPFEDLNDATDAGAVVVLFGSVDGLVTAGSLFLSQNTLPPSTAESTESDDLFGFTLAARRGLLAIAAPGETYIPGFESHAGRVHVLTTSAAGSPLDENADWQQNDLLDECTGGDGNELEDRWGESLAVSRTGPTVIAGARFEDHSGFENAGRVTMLTTGVGAGCFDQARSGVVDDPEESDEFGASLAVGDFNSDGDVDLAVGVPGERPGSTGAFGGGFAHVFFGTDSGLSAAGDDAFAQDNFPEGDLEGGDRFGATLASGDFDANGASDLAIGVPGEDVGGARNAGMVHVRYGGTGGFDSDRDETFHSDGPGMPDSANEGDVFGTTLAAGDFDGNDTDDLVIGAPDEGLGSQAAAGAITVLYGFDSAYDGLGQVRFLASTSSVSEQTANRLVLVERSGSAVVAASVRHSRTGGAATAGVDFNYSGGTESWSKGDIGHAFFPVQIVSDTLEEGDETIVIALSSPSAGLAVSPASGATFTMTIADDDEGGLVRVQPLVYLFPESSDTATVVVSRSDGEASGVTVPFATSNGSATAGSDFVATSGTLTFGAGETSKTIEVELIDDGSDEPTEQLTLTLSSPGGGAMLGHPASTSIFLTDNDPTPLFADGFETGDTSRWAVAP